MHLAGAFIQDKFHQFILFLRIQPIMLTFLAPCCTSGASPQFSLGSCVRTALTS